MNEPGSDGLLGAANALRLEAAARDPWLNRLRLAGIGWATVELERAAEELGLALRRAGSLEPAWNMAPRDDVLGATAWTSPTGWTMAAGDEPPVLVLLEPDTEARLAAALARHDEGVRAIYLAPRPGESIDPASATRLGASTGGPLGRQRIVLARPAWGPHVLVLAAPPVAAPPMAAP